MSIEDTLLAVNLRHEGTEEQGGDMDDCLCVSVYMLDINKVNNHQVKVIE